MATAELASISTRFTPDSVQEYVVYEAVPTFKEHYSHDAEMYLGKAEMEKIAKHCNERIADTGDYPPLVIGHNEKDRDPEVVGYADHFFVAEFGRIDPKWTIHCNWHVFTQDAQRIKRYPRVSVEYWFSPKDPGGGYFDPISLLGAATPELSLGSRIAYERNPDRTDWKRACYSRLVKYAADAAPAAPGGSNTYVPGDDSKRKTEYGKGDSMADDFSPGQIAIITEVVKNCMAEVVSQMNPVNTGIQDGKATFGAEPEAEAVPGAEEQPGDAVGDAAGDMPPGADAQADEAKESAESADAMGDAPPDADAAADAGDDAAETDSEDTGDVDGVSFDEDGDEMKKLAKYQADGNRDGAVKYLADLPDFKQRAIRSCYQRYTADDARSTFYKSLDGSSSDSGAASTPAAATTANVESGDPAGGASDLPSGASDNDRQLLAKYRRETEEYRTKYQKEFREHSELKAKYQKLEAEATESKKEALRVSRYQKLSQLEREGFVIDPDDEMKDCASMTDEQFESHQNRIRAKYQKIPLGQLPGEKPIPTPSSDPEADIQQRVTYAKKAAEVVEQRRANGQKAEYFDVLKELKAADRHNGAALVG